jgi:hypothetical protein
MCPIVRRVLSIRNTEAHGKKKAQGKLMLRYLLFSAHGKVIFFFSSPLQAMMVFFVCTAMCLFVCCVLFWHNGKVMGLSCAFSLTHGKPMTLTCAFSHAQHTLYI